jgi:hypothetical protein
MEARMGEWLTFDAASERLGVTPSEVGRRLREGKLIGRKKTTAQGPMWLVRMPEGDGALGEESLAIAEGTERDETIRLYRRVVCILQEELAARRGAASAEVKLYEQVLPVLQGELAARRSEVQELHALLQQAQDQIRLLSAPQTRRPRWQFWRRPSELATTG